jgi:hypothetical protein
MSRRIGSGRVSNIYIGQGLEYWEELGKVDKISTLKKKRGRNVRKG